VARACTTLSTVTAAERKSWSKVKGQQGRSGDIIDDKCSETKRRSDGYFSWKRHCSAHLYIIRESGQPQTLMGLLHAEPNSYNISYRGIQLLSTSTYLPLAKVGRLCYISRNNRFCRFSSQMIQNSEEQKLFSMQVSLS
jgi:hypothetical protein